MIIRIYSHSFYLSVILFIFSIVYSSNVYADGGAPQLAYVSGTVTGISIIDIAQQRVTGTIPETGNPQTILLSPDGQYLYITQPNLGQIAVITTKTQKTYCITHLPGQPSHLALSLDATILYAGGEGDTSVRAINPLNCTIERTFQTHEPVNGLAITAATTANATPSTSNQLWITGKNHITVFDSNGNLLGTIPIAGGPEQICIPGGFTAYVTTNQGQIVAIDLATRHVFRTLLSGGTYGTMDYNANTGQIYVPDKKQHQIDILTPVIAGTNAIPSEPERTIHLNNAPESIAISSDGQLGFVALSSGEIIMLDIPAHSIINTIVVGGQPGFVITGLYPPLTTSTAQPTTTSSAALWLDIPTQLLTLLLIAGIGILSTLGLIWKYYQKRSSDPHLPRKRQ